jgi:hypothetical protein
MGSKKDPIKKITWMGKKMKKIMLGGSLFISIVIFNGDFFYLY